MNAQLVAVLKDKLTQEKEIYRNLLSLSARKKDILVKNDIEGLNTILCSEKECLGKIKLLQKHRAAILEDITGESGLKGKLSFNEIIKNLRGSERREMKSLKEEFEKIVAELKSCNDLNSRLIKTHMEYNAFCISVLANSTSAADTYGKKGRINEAKANGFIDQMI